MKREARKSGRGGSRRVNYSGDSSILPRPHLKTTGEWLCEPKTRAREKLNNATCRVKKLFYNFNKRVHNNVFENSIGTAIE